MEEPERLAKVRTLARGLEEEPLELGVVLVGAGCERNIASLVVLAGDVLNDRIGLPVRLTSEGKCTRKGLEMLTK